MSRAQHPDSPEDDDGRGGAPSPGGDGPRGREGRAVGGSGDQANRVGGVEEQFGTGVPLDAAVAGPVLADALGLTRLSLGGLSDDTLAAARSAGSRSRRWETTGPGSSWTGR
jgi:hypothetical protein